MRSLLLILIGAASLWVFQPTYSQFEHPSEWIGELAAIALGLALIVGGICNVQKGRTR